MGEQIDTRQLPEVITEYLAAHEARDLDLAHACCNEDADALDEGHTYRGKREIGDWLARTSGEFAYTMQLMEAQRVDDDHYVAVHISKVTSLVASSICDSGSLCGTGASPSLVIEP
jgi:hypothetical protein